MAVRCGSISPEERPDLQRTVARFEPESRRKCRRDAGVARPAATAGATEYAWCTNGDTASCIGREQPGGGWEGRRKEGREGEEGEEGWRGRRGRVGWMDGWRVRGKDGGRDGGMDGWW